MRSPEGIGQTGSPPEMIAAVEAQVDRMKFVQWSPEWDDDGNDPIRHPPERDRRFRLPPAGTFLTRKEHQPTDNREDVVVEQPDIAATRSLDASAVHFWQVENAVGGVGLVIVTVALTQAPFVSSGWQRGLWIAAGCALGYAVFEALVVIPRRFRYYHYGLTADSIIVDQGRRWRRRRVYPLSRVLYCETRQGPILSWFGLFMVRPATIVDSPAVGPLTKAEADRFESALREHTS